MATRAAAEVQTAVPPLSSERQVTWPDDAFFAETARVQAGLIGSARFRELAARVLAAQSPGNA